MMSTTRSLGKSRPMIRGVLVGLLGAVLLAGCGGSDDDEPALSDPVQTDAQNLSIGTVEGTADTWVAVNGVRFDKQSTEVVNEEGEQVSVEALQIGMQVEVAANAVNRNNGVGAAARIAFGTAALGEVEAVDAAAKQIKVLGQTIQASNGTVFGGFAGGLGDVKVGALVNVHGLLDATSGVTSATRVDAVKAANRFALRGVISEVNVAAKTLKVGGQLTSLAKLRSLNGLANANGKVARVLLEKQKVNGQLVARAIASDNRFVKDGKAVDIESIVTEVTSSTAFKLFGLAVDGSEAQFVNQAGLKVGARAEVRGALAAGVLAATNVDVKAAAQRNVQLQGGISALNADAKTFTVRGVTIEFGGNNVTFVGGNAADLADGKNVLVKGVVTANGTRVAANSIEFK